MKLLPILANKNNRCKAATPNGVAAFFCSTDSITNRHYMSAFIKFLTNDYRVGNQLKKAVSMTGDIISAMTKFVAN